MQCREPQRLADPAAVNVSNGEPTQNRRTASEVRRRAGGARLSTNRRRRTLRQPAALARLRNGGMVLARHRCSGGARGRRPVQCETASRRGLVYRRVALHPGDVVRAKALDNPRVGQSPFILAAGTNAKASFAASFDSLRLNLDDVHLDLSFTDSYDWPKAFAGGGIWS